MGVLINLTVDEIFAVIEESRRPTTHYIFEDVETGVPIVVPVDADPLDHGVVEGRSYYTRSVKELAHV